MHNSGIFTIEHCSFESSMASTGDSMFFPGYQCSSCKIRRIDFLERTDENAHLFARIHIKESNFTNFEATET